jgi:hypothetical protein
VRAHRLRAPSRLLVVTGSPIPHDDSAQRWPRASPCGCCRGIAWTLPACEDAQVTTFILTWDGDEAGYPPADLAADISITEAGHLAPGRWSVGSRRGGINEGDRVFLLRQGTDRGMVASGRIAKGAVFEEAHWEDVSKTARYVEVEWDRALPTNDRLSIEELLLRVPGHHWNSIFSSGQQMNLESEAALEEAWADHVRELGRGSDRWTLAVGGAMGRRARMEQYGGPMYGGIQPSTTSPNVFIYSDPSTGTVYGYNYDGWSEDGSVFLYTGEGRKGHQKMQAGNAAILNHAVDGRALRLFVADGTEPGSDAKVQRYVGEFEASVDTPYVTAEAPDEDGNPRTVIVFRLVPVGQVLMRKEDASTSGDAAVNSAVEPVPVDAATTPPGSAEAVPVETTGTNSYTVAGSTGAVAVKWEAELQARYQAYLEARGSTCVRYKLRPPGELRDLYTDLFDETENVLYEAKGVATREAVRMAIGQLLDYSRYIPTKPSLAVLLPARPADDLRKLLVRLKIRCVFETSPGKFEDESRHDNIAKEPRQS